jgi:hypothetical protein
VHDEQNLRHAAPRVRRQVLLPVGNGIAPRRREQHDEERGFLRRELRRRLSEIHARGVANAVEARPELDEIDVERQDFALRERLVQRPCPDHLADFPGDRLFLREVDVLHDLLRDGARAAGEAPFLDVLQQATAPACDHAQGAPARLSWARLLKRVFDIDIEHCPNCGGSLKIIAAPSTRLRTGIEDPPVIVRILTHLGLPTRALPRAPAQRVDLFQTI